MLTVTPGVLTTTAAHIDGRPVREWIGLASGESIVTLDSSSPESNTSLARGLTQSLQALSNRASEDGATVVVGINIRIIPLDARRLLVCATGTAARL